MVKLFLTLLPESVAVIIVAMSAPPACAPRGSHGAHAAGCGSSQREPKRLRERMKMPPPLCLTLRGLLAVVSFLSETLNR